MNGETGKEKALIDIMDDANIAMWCERLNCSMKDLLEAISKVGNSATAVDAYLTMNHKK